MFADPNKQRTVARQQNELRLRKFARAFPAPANLSVEGAIRIEYPHVIQMKIGDVKHPILRSHHLANVGKQTLRLGRLVIADREQGIDGELRLSGPTSSMASNGHTKWAIDML